jgi:hypothetical protein
VSADPARDAIDSLPGREEVPAENQDGDRYNVAVQSVAGGVISVLAPRMKVGAIESLALRFQHDGEIWLAACSFAAAEYHSDELALVQLELRAVEAVAVGERAPRTTHHALGKLRIIQAKHVLPRNEYPITVEDTSETGLRFICDFDIAVDDTFTVTANLEESLTLHIRARAVAIEPAAFGRSMVRARIDYPG